VVVESATLKKSGLAVGAHTQALSATTRAGHHRRRVTLDTSIAGHPGTDRRRHRARGVRTRRHRAVVHPDREPGVSQDELRSRTAAVLPADAEAVNRQEVGEETKKQIDTSSGSSRSSRRLRRDLAPVGAFIIGHVLDAGRPAHPWLALLRALGASRASAAGGAG